MILPGAGSEVGLETESEGFSAAVDEGFGSGNRDVEDAGDFLVGQFLFAEKEDGGALVLGQFAEGFVDFRRQFVEENLAGHAAGLGVGGIAHDRAVIGGQRGVEGFGGVSGSASDLVEAKIAGDGEEPGGEAGGDSVATGRLPGLDEHLLREVFGFVGVAERSLNEIEDGLAVLFDQGFECREVALLDAEHARGIVVGTVDHPGHARG